MHLRPTAEEARSGASHADQQLRGIGCILVGGASGTCAFAGIGLGDWQPDLIVPISAVLRLLDVYYETAYPIFPFFVWPDVIEKVSNKDHLRQRPFYGAAMAAAALALARIRDSAPSTHSLSAVEISALPTAEALFAASEGAIPKDLSDAQDFDYVRASALLALVSIQFARPRKLQQHLGTYWTLCSINRLHDEQQWVSTLSVSQKEERRRVLWSMYTLDIFATLSFGAALRSRQASLLVRFPSHTDAECVRSDAAPSESVELASDPWLTGWNFVTELYKTLEYALDSPQRGSATAFDFLDSAYLSLPVEFREMRPFSGNAAEDRIGYQTANIRVTMQTVKMVLVCHDLSFSEKRAQALQIAESLLEDIDSVPLPYLQAISAPLLHHLVGIYKLILPITEYALSFDAFSRIRQILIDITRSLQRLQSGLTYSANVIKRFQSQIARMDAAQSGASSRAASRAASPRTDPTNQSATVGHALASTASFEGVPPAPAPDLVSWESAFELQDVFQDWPFDFDPTWIVVENNDFAGTTGAPATSLDADAVLP
ncbi:hypothetical protein JCM8202v2_005015 [Rhodotorula sphaerocarpa]